MCDKSHLWKPPLLFLHPDNTFWGFYLTPAPVLPVWNTATTTWGACFGSPLLSPPLSATSSPKNTGHGKLAHMYDCFYTHTQTKHKLIALSSQPSSLTFSSAAIPLLCQHSHHHRAAERQNFGVRTGIRFQSSQVLHPTSHLPQFTPSSRCPGSLGGPWLTLTTTTDTPSHIDLFPTLRQDWTPRATSGPPTC